MAKNISPTIGIVNTILQLTARNIPLIVQAQLWLGSRLDNQRGLASREFKGNHSEKYISFWHRMAKRSTPPTHGSIQEIELPKGRRHSTVSPAVRAWKVHGRP